MTVAQALAVEQRLKTLASTAVLAGVHLHHGDCEGADAQVHRIARKLGFFIEGHPPRLARKRAFCTFDIIQPEMDYMARNRAIVDVCDILVAAPATRVEILRSGTWATMRYAHKTRTPYYGIGPDGAIVKVKK
jgi:hypothetical protein